MKDNSERKKHESFGQIQFNRVNGHARFYGSELEQRNYISLEIHRSEMIRDLMDERYYPNEQIIRVRMSSGQFSELITSMNLGTGVPCTIERVLGKKQEPLPIIENKKDQVNREFKNRMKLFGDTIIENKNKALDIVKKKSLSKQDIHDISHLLNWIITEVESNIPFFAECFQETTDKVVNEAKIEIENALLHKVNSLGLLALNEENKKLSS